MWGGVDGLTEPDKPVLEVEDLAVHYHGAGTTFRVVDGASLRLRREEILGLAGESGCGKSTMVEGILRLVQAPGEIPSGRVLFHPRTGPAVDILRLGAEEVRRLRWTALAYVPQGSMNSLNPVARIADQLTDAMTAHGVPTDKITLSRLGSLLASVGLSPDLLSAYPHQLSGGMRQRVLIANSLALGPDVVIADEPTTGLDVNAQRMVLETLLRARREHHSALLFVSHDLAVHAELVDRVAVMYAGQVVELGEVEEIFSTALHPYTIGLLASMPRMEGPRKRLFGIPGLAPSPANWPVGCRFHPRCPFAFDRCRSESPVSREDASGHLVACHLYEPTESKRLDAMRARLTLDGGRFGTRLQDHPV